jgi:hypothetical protein
MDAPELSSGQKVDTADYSIILRRDGRAFVKWQDRDGIIFLETRDAISFGEIETMARVLKCNVDMIHQQNGDVIFSFVRNGTGHT